MTSQAPLPETPAAAPASAGGDAIRASFARQLHVLDDLIDAGVMMAQAVAREAAEPAGPGTLTARDVCDLALAFSRIERAVRYSVLLGQRLGAALEAYDRAQASPTAMAAWLEAHAGLAATRADAAPAPASAPAALDAAPVSAPDAVQARKDQAAEALRRLIAEQQADKPDVEALERLERQAALRLRDDPRLNDILTLPVSEVIDMICRDLGIQPDWLRLSEEDWARGELRSGKVGAALAAAVLAGTAPEGAGTNSLPDGGPGTGRSEAAQPPTPLGRPSWRPPLRAAQAARRRRRASG